MGAGEYSLSLPVRPFVESFLHKISKPLAAYLNDPLVSPAALSGDVDKIPSSLSVHANVWVKNGSMSKLQIFIPHSSASVLIGVSHPAAAVEVPNGATMLSQSSLTELIATAEAGALSATGGLFKTP